MDICITVAKSNLSLCVVPMQELLQKRFYLTHDCDISRDALTWVLIIYTFLDAVLVMKVPCEWG